jgi:replicative DNA helicase
LETLTGAEFSRPAHGLIFKAAKEITLYGKLVDVVGIEERLSSSGHLDAVGGSAGLTDIVSYRSKGRWEDHLEIIVDKHKLRQLEKAAGEVLEIVHDTELATADEKIESALDKISRIETRKAEEEQMIIGSVARKIFAQIDEVQENGLTIAPKVSTGFSEYDRITNGGDARGTITVIGARPGMGKTALLGKVAVHTAMEGGVVHVATLEMNKDQFTQRVLSLIGKFPTTWTDRTAYLPEPQYREVADAVEMLSSLKLEVNDDSYLTLSKLSADLSRTRRKHSRIDRVFIDYWQLMKGESKGKEMRAQELKVIADGLKGLAKNFDCSIWLMAQVKQDVETREEKRPEASDLKDSNGAEEAADILCTLYRDEYYRARKEKRAESQSSTAELLIRKNRNGALGKVDLAWTPEFVRFTDAA